MTDQPRAESFYHPGRVRQILRNWDSYLALELNGPAARGLLSPGPTPESPSPGARQKGHHGDPMAGVPVVADIIRAWKALGAQTDEYRVVMFLMFQHSDAGIAAGMKRPEGDIGKMLESASEKMAVFLGWESENLHPYQEAIRACEECGARIDDLRLDARYCSPACRLKGWRGERRVTTATG